MTSRSARTVASSPLLTAPRTARRLYLWDVATGKLAVTLQCPAAAAPSLTSAFSPNGRFLAVADAGGAVVVWNVATGKSLASLFDQSGQPLIGVAFSPRGKTIATKGDGRLYVHMEREVA